MKTQFFKKVVQGCLMGTISVLIGGSLVSYALNGSVWFSMYDSLVYGSEDVFEHALDVEKKKVEGDIPEELLPEAFEFEITPYNYKYNEDTDSYDLVEEPFKESFEVSQSKAPYKPTTKGQVIKLKEITPPPEGYSVEADIEVTKTYKLQAKVHGYYQGDEGYTNIYGDSLDCSDEVFIQLDQQAQIHVASRDTRKSPITIEIYNNNYDTNDFSLIKEVYLPVEESKVSIDNLPQGSYCFVANTEHFIATSGENKVNSNKNEATITTDDTGEFTIERKYAHNGITKYQILDDTGMEVKVVSIGMNTEGQKVTISGLDANKEYTIVSDDLESGKTVTISATTSKTYKEGEPIDVGFGCRRKIEITNHYEELPDVGDLIIRKFVYGAAANKEDTFDFRLTLLRENPDYTGDVEVPETKSKLKKMSPKTAKTDQWIPTNECDHDVEKYGLDFTNGVALFTLKDQEGVHVTNLPLNVRYMLEEYDASSHDYTTTIDGEHGVISTETSEAISISTREEETPVYGTYKYVHEYYVQDKEGNLSKEGTSLIGESAEINIKDKEQFTLDVVTKQPNFRPDGAENEYLYDFTEAKYGTTTGEGADFVEDSSMSYVVATEERNQIIILKYVRQLPEEKGYYSVVHEYYHEDIEGNRELVGSSDIFSSDKTLPLDDTAYTVNDVTKQPNYNGVQYDYESVTYGILAGSNYTEDPDKTGVVATKDGSEIIILKYVIVDEPVKEGTYSVVHEYYREESDGSKVKEGVSDIGFSETLPVDNTVFTGDDITKVTKHSVEGKEYEYEYTEVHYGNLFNQGSDDYSIDTNMNGVVATEDGLQIIILQYLRKVKVEPPVQEDKEGTLVINKTVTGDDADSSFKFKFELTLSDTMISGKVGDLVFESGKASFELQDGESTSISLPEGIDYSVTELAVSDFTTKALAPEGTIVGNETTEVVFLNNYEKPEEPDKPEPEEPDDKEDPDSLSKPEEPDDKEDPVVKPGDKDDNTAIIPDTKVPQDTKVFGSTVKSTKAQSDTVVSPINPVRTGDTADVAIWIVLLIISGLSVMSVSFKIVKNRRKG